MLWSSACEYAVRATTFLGARPDVLVQLRAVAAAEGIPAPFAAKILQALTRAGILRSSRGPGGGYGLARPPAEITFLDIKAAIDGTRDLDACAAGLGRCGEDVPCPLHETFEPIRRAIRNYLTTTTVADLSTAMVRKRAVLARRAARRGGTGSRRR